MPCTGRHLLFHAQRKVRHRHDSENDFSFMVKFWKLDHVTSWTINTEFLPLGTLDAGYAHNVISRISRRRLAEWQVKQVKHIVSLLSVFVSRLRALQEWLSQISQSVYANRHVLGLKMLLIFHKLFREISQNPHLDPIYWIFGRIKTLE